MKYDQQMVDDLFDHILKADSGEDGMVGSIRVAADKVRAIRGPQFKSVRTYKRDPRVGVKRCLAAGGLMRCMDCRCGIPHVKGERPQTWADFG